MKPSTLEVNWAIQIYPDYIIPPYPHGTYEHRARRLALGGVHHRDLDLASLRSSNMACWKIHYVFFGDFPIETLISIISSGFPASHVWLPDGNQLNSQFQMNQKSQKVSGLALSGVPGMSKTKRLSGLQSKRILWKIEQTKIQSKYVKWSNTYFFWLNNH